MGDNPSQSSQPSQKVHLSAAQHRESRQRARELVLKVDDNEFAQLGLFKRRKSTQSAMNLAEMLELLKQRKVSLVLNKDMQSAKWNTPMKLKIEDIAMIGDYDKISTTFTASDGTTQHRRTFRFRVLDKSSFILLCSIQDELDMIAKGAGVELIPFFVEDEAQRQAHTIRGVSFFLRTTLFDDSIEYADTHYTFGEYKCIVLDFSKTLSRSKDGNGWHSAPVLKYFES